MSSPKLKFVSKSKSKPIVGVAQLKSKSNGGGVMVVQATAAASGFVEGDAS